MTAAIVTGASRGIGRAIAEQLAADGYDVAFCYRADDVAAKETAALVEAHGRRVHAERVDVADRAEVRRFVAAAEEALGPAHAVVANAGVTRDRPLALMDDADWDTVLRTNLDGVHAVCRATVFGMMRRRAGAIVVVSSVAGIGGQAGQTNYAASKAGALGFTRSLAKEVGRHGVRANVVAPGFVESDMVAAMREPARAAASAAIPLGGFGEPRHVADAVSFLVSDRAAYVTGAVLRVDGGMSI